MPNETQIFSNPLFTNNKAFSDGLSGALEQLRRKSYIASFPTDNEKMTSPEHEQNSTWNVMQTLAKIVGVYDQNIPITAGKWHDANLSVSNESGVLVATLVAGLFVQRWGQYKDRLNGQLVATCEHNGSTRRYVLQARLDWNTTSLEAIGRHTDRTTREVLGSQATSGRGRRVERSKPQPGDDGDGRSRLNDKTDEI